MPERLRIQKAEKNNPKLIVIKNKHHHPLPELMVFEFLGLHC